MTDDDLRAWCHNDDEAEELCQRVPGCLCQWEEGDSPCPVHGEDDE